ncbi:Transcription initiation factor TFIID subunit 2 [Venturia inaequalis]|nr:Transcription initiation factor TFIID subunit 2 [Venturia inaequalis]
MKFTAVLAFLAFAATTIALPTEEFIPKCGNGCLITRWGTCPPSC